MHPFGRLYAVRVKVGDVAADAVPMERPPLTLALASVLAARVDGDRRHLLAAMRPAAPPDDTPRPVGPAPRLAVVPTPLASVTHLPRVIPWPRRPVNELDPQPDPAA